jgi:hypothetical protein
MRDNFILPKKDVTATKALRANRFFCDIGSYITLPDEDGNCHFILEGQDRGRIRGFVENAARGRCEALHHAQGCKGNLYFGSEMDHIRGGNSGRCDCFRHGKKKGNLRMLSIECHKSKHVQVLFGEGRAEGHRDFERLYTKETT